MDNKLKPAVDLATAASSDLVSIVKGLENLPSTQKDGRVFKSDLTVQTMAMEKVKAAVQLLERELHTLHDLAYRKKLFLIDR